MKSFLDIRLYCQIASNIPLRTKFESDIQVLSASFIKPEEVLRRFNLDGDGHLDFREFQLAMRRLGSKSEPRDMYDLFRAFCSRTRRKLGKKSMITCESDTKSSRYYALLSDHGLLEP